MILIFQYYKQSTMVKQFHNHLRKNPHSDPLSPSVWLDCVTELVDLKGEVRDSKSGGGGRQRPPTAGPGCSHEEHWCPPGNITQIPTPPCNPNLTQQQRREPE